ncbi:uncharacterized protein LOC124372418 [Homalodisca vitripennis]|uniref:uncharacterized protein LOC124372418 n=1 Tax=Homalodisca vitripennis TaxID=197043 RepID=UPI001EECCE59|nr:uncharacterized protein LOC124372418 [Homalodisca vitripennis]
MFCKQIYICLSAFNPDGPTYAHIYTGKFEWYSPTVAPLVFMLTTSATAGYTLALSPGLHVFRVWYQFPVHFCLQIFSNTMFTLGSKMYIQQMLSPYSESFQFYGEKISSAFEQLLRAVEGGAEHGSAYSQLMACLHPPQLREQLVWPQWLMAHTELLQAFEESLTEMLAEWTQFPGEMYQVLVTFQMLFLNPVFGEQTLLKVRCEYYDYVQQRRWSKRQKEILLEEELKERLAQAGDTKGKKSPKSDKTGKPTKESLKKGSVKSAKTGKTGKQKEAKGKTKAVSKREQLRTLLQCKEKSLFLGDHNLAIIILKKMMTKVPHLKRLYPFRFEDDFRLVFQDYVGEVEVSDKWVVLVRCVMNLHSTGKVPCSLHIWCPLQKMLLRLIDNDTEQDVPLGFVENSVTHLTKNIGGYTLCVYGITDLPVVPWRLRSIGVSEIDSLHMCVGQECHDTHIQPPQQFQQSLHGFYVPNKDMLITRCLLEAYADVTVMLRLSLSSDSVVCSFTILDELGNSVLNTSGVGHIIIPVLKLKGKERSRRSEVLEERTSSTRPCVYTLEVRLLHNSWPLSLDQRKAMLYYKEHLPDIILNSQADSIGEEDSLIESESLVDELDLEFFRDVNKPSWSLTLVANEQKVMPVRLREDMTLFDQLRELQSKWKEEGNDAELCQQLRQDFLTQIAGAEEDMSEEAMFHLKPNKTEELTQLLGRCSSIRSLARSVPSDLRHFHDFLKFSRQSEDKMSRISLSSQISISLHPLTPKPSRPLESSSVVSGEQKLEDSIKEESLKIDHRDMLVQQAGINKALADLRAKNMERLQDVFEQTALLRTQLISEIKAAKEAELKKQKEEKAKSKKSQDKSPDKKTKGQDLNKSKSKKSKGK